MEIKTNRLVIKSLSPFDRKGMIYLLNNKEIKKTYMIPDFNNEEESIVYFNKLLTIPNDEKHYLCGVYLNNKIIGMVNDVFIKDKEIELGYFIDPVYWKNGYATEVLKAMINTMFELGYTRVITGYFEENPASGRVMQKCGMTPIEQVDYITYQDKKHKCLYYEIRNK